MNRNNIRARAGKKYTIPYGPIYHMSTHQMAKSSSNSCRSCKDAYMRVTSLTKVVDGMHEQRKRTAPDYQGTCLIVVKYHSQGVALDNRHHSRRERYQLNILWVWGNGVRNSVCDQLLDTIPMRYQGNIIPMPLSRRIALAMLRILESGHLGMSKNAGSAI